jgi:hypothetical protein
MRYHYFNSISYPTWGGVLIGAPTAEPSLKFVSATIGREGEDIYIQVAAQKDGERLTGRFQGFTATELGSAYRFVLPERLQLEPSKSITPGNCALVGLEEDETDQGTDHTLLFGVHPAVSQTLLASEAMLMDLFPSSFYPAAFGPYSQVESWQWYDRKSVFRFEDSALHISDENRRPLMHLRLWMVTEADGRRQRELQSELREEVHEELSEESLGQKGMGIGPTQFRQLDHRHIGDIIRSVGRNARPSPDIEERLQTSPEYYRVEAFARCVALLNWILVKKESCPSNSSKTFKRLGCHLSNRMTLYRKQMFQMQSRKFIE